MQNNENWVTGISPETGTQTKKRMCSSDRIELRKECKLNGKAFLGVMHFFVCVSIKIEDQGNFSTKTGSVQVPLHGNLGILGGFVVVVSKGWTLKRDLYIAKCQVFRNTHAMNPFDAVGFRASVHTGKL
jgi:hypothetical protein